jgi:hypothetical protein
MPPLITREEALSLGELEDHSEIAALMERAWQVRVERLALDVHPWDPSTQLRFAPKRQIPKRPDPARAPHPEVSA